MPTKVKRSIKSGNRQPMRSVQRPDVVTDVTRGPRIPRSNFLTTALTAVPQSTRRTLSWSYPAQYLVSATSMTTLIQIRLNSLYDPDVALGGTSATGFAKLMAFYSKYSVIGARVKLRLVNSNASGDQPALSSILGGVTITTDLTTLSTPQLAISSGLVDYDIIGISPDKRTFELGVDIAKFVDKPDILDDANFSGTSSSNPNQIVAAQCWVWNYSALAKYATFAVEVQYDAVFTDPIPFT